MHKLIIKHSGLTRLLSITSLIATMIVPSCKGGSSEASASGGGGQNGALSAPLVSKSQTIGPEGGEITADDGSWKLTVPQFAMRFPQEIKISVDATPVGSISTDYKKLTKVFKFEPEGLFFERPAQFLFKYDQSDMPEGGLQEKLLGIYYVHDDSSLERTRTSVNLALNEATSELKHFSFGVGLTVQVFFVNAGLITNSTSVLNIANTIIAHFASLADDAARQAEYLSQQSLIDAFITKTEQILGYNPLFQAYPGIFPPGTTGGYKVSYNANGAEAGSAPTDTTIYASGANVTMPGNTGTMTRANYTFAGWNTAADGSGTLYVAGAGLAIGSANVTLYARWIENPKYSISYLGNTSTGGTAPLDASQYYTGTSVMVAPNSGGLYKTGNLFLGWNTQADGNGTNYAIGQSLSVGSTNISLYAVWQSRFTRMAGASTKPTRGQGVIADKDGNIFVAGYTDGDLNGIPINGTKDGFLIKYDRSGALQWTKLIGLATRQANALGLAADSAGNIYVCGSTNGSLGGVSLTGLQDTFIMKYDTSGTLLWTRLLGVASANTFPWLGNVLSIDSSGNIFVSGQTNGNLGGQTKSGLYDAFVAKYAADGTLNWVRLSGVATKNTNAYGLVTDLNGNVFAAGLTAADIDGQVKTGTSDAFLMKYNSSGVKQWTRLTGATGVATTTLSVQTNRTGDVYVAGNTSADIDGQTRTGTTDAMLIKFDTNGIRLWTRLHGVATSGTNATTLAVDPFDQVYLCGTTDGNLGAQIKTGNVDTFLAKFDPTGDRKYTRLIGATAKTTVPFSCASDHNGNIFGAGYANGNLDGQTLTGTEDMFLTNKLMDTSLTEVYTVTYNGNGHTGGSVPVDSGVYSHGAPVTVAQNTGNLVRNDYNYIGWNAQANGSGNARVAGKQFGIGPADETIHAQWRSKWTRLSGGAGGSTTSQDIAIDGADNVVSVNITNSAPDGLTKIGINDLYITKHDKFGNKLWSKLLGAAGCYTFVSSVVISAAGNIIIAGNINGALNGEARINSSSYDSFILSLSSAGIMQWTKLFGTSTQGGSWARSLTSDDQGNIYVTGYTYGSINGEPHMGGDRFYDAFITKYSAAGTHQWTRMSGVPGTYTLASQIVHDDNNLYLVGYTQGNLHGKVNPGYFSAFVIAYDFSGNRVWTTLIGGLNSSGNPSYTGGYGIASQNCGGSIFITGETTGTLGQAHVTNWGINTGFISALARIDGTLLYPNSMPDSYFIRSMSNYGGGASGQRIICPAQGQIRVLARFYSAPSLSYAAPPIGNEDAYVYDPNANLITNSLMHLGIAGAATYGSAFAVDSNGILNVSGYTYGNLDGQTKNGTYDVFLSTRINR